MRAVPLQTTRRHMARINIVPYIDVMLVLLLIFMIATPLMQQGVLIDLPKAPSEPVKVEPYKEPLVLEIDKNGDFRLIREGVFSNLVAEADLPTLVEDMMREGNDDTLYVRADAGLSYGEVVATIARLNQAGVSTLSLLTQPAPGES